MINRMKKILHINPLKRLALIYVLCGACCLVWHTAYTAINVYGYATGKYTEKNLTLDDFEIKDGEIPRDMTIINRSDDTQMIYTGDVRNLMVKCRFSLNPGEFVCFYNDSDYYSFGTHKMEYAKVCDGYYIFEFPLGTKQIRLDTGIFPSVTTVFEQITVNKPSVYTVTNLSTGDLFSLLVLPACCFMVAETILAAVIKKKK